MRNSLIALLLLATPAFAEDKPCFCTTLDIAAYDEVNKRLPTVPLMGATKEAVTAQRKLINDMIAWASALSDPKAKAAYLHWLEMHRQLVNSAEREMLTGERQAEMDKKKSLEKELPKPNLPVIKP